jgi:hypothetical protein
MSAPRSGYPRRTMWHRSDRESPPRTIHGPPIPIVLPWHQTQANSSLLAHLSAPQLAAPFALPQLRADSHRAEHQSNCTEALGTSLSSPAPACNTCPALHLTVQAPLGITFKPHVMPLLWATPLRQVTEAIASVPPSSSSERPHPRAVGLKTASKPPAAVGHPTADGPPSTLNHLAATSSITALMPCRSPALPTALVACHR